MKTLAFRALRLLALSSGLLVAAHAQTVNLTTTLTGGTYTYYALGDSSGNAVTPFTVEFYPGTSSVYTQETGLAPTTTGGAPISFATGKLTDSTSSSTSFVTGWTGVAELANPSTTGTTDGQFAILFNLGAVYNLSEVDITYINASGQRWSTTADAQSVYTATSFAGSMTNFTLLGSQTFNSTDTTTNTTAAYTGNVDAQYVLLVLTGTMSAAGTTGSVGGKLVNVSILGDATAIPEPATTAALISLAALVPLWLRRRNRRRS